MSTAAQDAVVAAVLPWIGFSLEHGAVELEAFVGGELHNFGKLLSPKISSCGLFALAIWADVGVDHHLLAEPYEIGQAITWAVQIAHDLAAIRYPHRDGLPTPGALMHYYSPRPSKNDHVEFCLSVLDEHQHARHAGGGRSQCGVAEGTDDILWSGGRPLQAWYDPHALLRI